MSDKDTKHTPHKGNLDKLPDTQNTPQQSQAQDPQGRPIGGAVSGSPNTGVEASEARQRTQAEEIQARSQAAFDEANLAANAGSSPAEGNVLNSVRQTLETLPDDAARRRVLRTAAQALGIAISFDAPTA